MAKWMRKGQKEGRKKKIAGKRNLNNKMMSNLISTHKQITQFFSI